MGHFEWLLLSSRNSEGCGSIQSSLPPVLSLLQAGWPGRLVRKDLGVHSGEGRASLGM